MPVVIQTLANGMCIIPKTQKSSEAETEEIGRCNGRIHMINVILYRELHMPDVLHAVFVSQGVQVACQGKAPICHAQFHASSQILFIINDGLLVC
jgi:hypothetical protein